MGAGKGLDGARFSFFPRFVRNHHIVKLPAIAAERRGGTDRHSYIWSSRNLSTVATGSATEFKELPHRMSDDSLMISPAEMLLLETAQGPGVWLAFFFVT